MIGSQCNQVDGNVGEKLLRLFGLRSEQGEFEIRLFPQTGYATYEMGTNTGSINVDGFITETDGKAPLYSPFWRPTTGHPDGYTYIYVCDDGQNVYFSLDVTGDNTNEFGEDWAEIRILQPDGTEQAFRIDDFNTNWGEAGFGLTGKVSYKHQTYEFAIPKSLIGSENIEFSLEYYGTYGDGVTLIKVVDDKWLYVSINVIKGYVNRQFISKKQ